VIVQQKKEPDGTETLDAGEKVGGVNWVSVVFVLNVYVAMLAIVVTVVHVASELYPNTALMAGLPAPLLRTAQKLNVKTSVVKIV
jgi:hypothetical protein